MKKSNQKIKKIFKRLKTMDINSSKKTLLSLINGGILGASPAGGSTVKFQIATGANAIARAAASTTAGALTFASDGNGNAAIFATDGNGEGTLVSSQILNITSAAKSGAKHGGKTVTITYVDTAQTSGTNTATFDVIDEAGLEAYFTGSKTIALDGTTDVYEVKTKANGGLAVDNNDGLYVNVGDFFAVDGSTIVQDSTSKKISTALGIQYVANDPDGDAAHIALVDNDGNEIDKVWVSDIIGNGVVDHTEYVPATNTLKIFFKKADGSLNEVDIDLSDLFDIDDWAVKSDSTDFLAMTIDSSAGTAEIGVKKADVTFTPAGAEAADLDVDTTNGEILVASDAIPAIKSYIDAVSADNGISAQGDSYIDASVDSVNNKKINVAAQTADLAVGKVGDADSTLSGTSGKLVDADDAANKVQSFVNARLSEEVAKLDASIDSAAGTFISAGVAEVDGKITSVVVHENIGSITGTATDLSGTAGLIDGADAATAVKAYVDGQIAALDSSVADETADEYISIAIEAANGKLTSAEIDYTKSTVEFDGTPGALDLTATNGIVTSDAISEIKAYVDAKSGALDSSVEDTDDGKGYVYVKTVQSDGALSQQIVNVTYGEITATPGAIQIDNNGIIDSSVLKEAVEGALTWTVLP